jgi:hypothetical protein
MCMCMCMYVCMYACMYVCMYVFAICPRCMHACHCNINMLYVQTNTLCSNLFAITHFVPSTILQEQFYAQRQEKIARNKASNRSEETATKEEMAHVMASGALCACVFFLLLFHCCLFFSLSGCCEQPTLCDFFFCQGPGPVSS